jgi:trk system potassium uptake protein TrkH
MNTSIIRYILGQVLRFESIFLLIPCLTAVIYRESSGFAYAGVALLCLALGLFMTHKKPKNHTFYLKEGCVITSLSWITFSIFGALPFYFSREIPSFTDALFETVSGFTTTGASIVSDVEALSHCTLIWRSFTHWIGGMGVLVFLLAIVPLSGGSNINLMRAESPGPSVGKLVPKMKLTARLLYGIYIVMTIIMIVLLLLGGMPLFESLCTAFGTAGTGGFGFLNDSMASFSPYIQWVITIFMILFGVNFNAYFFILYKQFRKAFTMEEVRYYFLIILGAIAIIFIDVLDMFSNAFETLTHVAFQVGSIITTTGYSTTNFDLWPETSRAILVLLMFVGACAGSTGGGMKVSRFVILFKNLGKEFHSYIHPRSVKQIQLDDKPVENEVVRSINVYCFAFAVIFCTSVLLISLEGYDFTTNFTAVAATINNIGPGLSLVGPSANFGFLSNFSKWVLTFDMLAGRLELFPLLLLFHPKMWLDVIQNKRGTAI